MPTPLLVRPVPFLWHPCTENSTYLWDTPRLSVCRSIASAFVSPPVFRLRLDRRHQLRANASTCVPKGKYRTYPLRFLKLRFYEGLSLRIMHQRLWCPTTPPCSMRIRPDCTHHILHVVLKVVHRSSQGLLVPKILFRRHPRSLDGNHRRTSSGG